MKRTLIILSVILTVAVNAQNGFRYVGVNADTIGDLKKKLEFVELSISNTMQNGVVLGSLIKVYYKERWYLNDTIVFKESNLKSYEYYDKAIINGWDAMMGQPIKESIEKELDAIYRQKQ